MRDAYLAHPVSARPSVDQLMASCERIYRQRVRRKVATILFSFALGVGGLLWAVTR